MERLTLSEHVAWIEAGGGQALWDELYAPFGVKPFMGGNTGVCMGGWFRRELKSLADLKGLKLRSLGLGVRRVDLRPVATGAVSAVAIAPDRRLFRRRGGPTYSRLARAWETARMNSQEIDLLKIYVMLSPLVVVAIGAGVYWLTGWMDRREQQRRPAE